LKARVARLEDELRLARGDVAEMRGLRLDDEAELNGLREDLEERTRGFEIECEEKEERIKERDELATQLEFLEAELDGVRAAEVSRLDGLLAVRPRSRVGRRFSRTSRRPRRPSVFVLSVRSLRATRCATHVIESYRALTNRSYASRRPPDFFRPQAELRAEVKAKTEELKDLTASRDDSDDEVRRLKDMSNTQAIEAAKMRVQLEDLRGNYAKVSADAMKFRLQAETLEGNNGRLQAKTTAAIDEAEKLRKWHDWAKASEVVSLQGELDVVKQERDMLQRDLQSRLAESRRLTTQNEDWAKDVKALRSDVFAREGKLGRCEAELAALNRSLKQCETELMVAKEQSERRGEDTAKAALDAVKLRAKFEEEKLRQQATLLSIRSGHQKEMHEAKDAHAMEMMAARKDAQAAWTLARELEAKVLVQSGMLSKNQKDHVRAMRIGQRITDHKAEELDRAKAEMDAIKKGSAKYEKMFRPAQDRDLPERWKNERLESMMAQTRSEVGMPGAPKTPGK
jgi:hypothetical protein